LAQTPSETLVSILNRAPVADKHIGKVCHKCYAHDKSEEIAKMPTRNISLTVEQDAFVEKLVNAGEYQNASEALRDALRALEQRRREDSLKLKALRIQIKAGIDAIKRGDFADVEGANLEDYLERLTAPRQRAR